MAEYRTVEGEPGAVNVLTELTTFGGETGVGPIVVPSNTRKLVEIWAAVGSGPDTALETGATILRLSGKGMTGGDQDFGLGAVGNSVTATAARGVPARIYPVDIQVTGGGEKITVQIAVTNADVLLGTTVITLVFA